MAEHQAVVQLLGRSCIPLATDPGVAVRSAATVRSSIACRVLVHPTSRMG
jgi:hypothetical protein